MHCRVTALCLLCLGLAACQSPNPYTASSNPLPPAPVQAAQTFDASAYPAAPRDYARYRSWGWFNDRLPIASTLAQPEQVADSVSQALDQRGLRPARNGQAPDLRVAADVRIEKRLRQVADDDGFGPYGRPYGPYGYANYPPRVRTYQVNVMVVDLHLFDGVTGQPVWSAAAETTPDGTQGQRDDALRDAIAKALTSFPPS